MFEFSQTTALSSAMPILGRGKHRNPSQGACFMEYTSLLAGEAFTDEPRCVDGELAAVLRVANDRLSDAARPDLVPLLGRAIGLAVEAPPESRGWRRSAAARRKHREERARYEEQTAALRRAVSARFTSTLGCTPSKATRMWGGHGEEVCLLFWDLMSNPTVPQRTEDYVTRLTDRLRLLHECYEQAMQDLGLPRLVPACRDVADGHPQDAQPQGVLSAS
jgi:hypothetical protein